MLSNANISQYKQLSKFKDKEHLNQSIRGFLYVYKHQLTQSTIDVYRLIANHSVKLGVAFLKYETIANIINKSVATVKRALKQLKELNAIEIHRTKRVKGKVRGGFGHNVFVLCDLSGELSKMNHRQRQDKPYESKADDHNVDTETRNSESNPLKDYLNKRKEQNVNFDKSFLSSNLPQQFINTVAPFSDNKTVYTLWHRLNLVTKKHADIGYIQAYMDDYLKAYKECIYKFKQGRIKSGSIVGYVYGSWVKVTRELVMRSKATKGIYYDWLKEA